MYRGNRAYILSYPYIVICYQHAPEYSALVCRRYRSLSHTAQVYNVFYTYCGGCAGFQSKDSYSLPIVCIDYIEYIYRFCWLKYYRHSSKKVCARIAIFGREKQFFLQVMYGVMT